MSQLDRELVLAGSRRQRREFEDAGLFSGLGVIAAAQREANPLELVGVVERHRRRR